MKCAYFMAKTLDMLLNHSLHILPNPEKVFCTNNCTSNCLQDEIILVYQPSDVTFNLHTQTFINNLIVSSYMNLRVHAEFQI